MLNHAYALLKDRQREILTEAQAGRLPKVAQAGLRVSQGPRVENPPEGGRRSLPQADRGQPRLGRAEAHLLEGAQTEFRALMAQLNGEGNGPRNEPQVTPSEHGEGPYLGRE